jgi:protein-disulfide isomerase
MVTSGVVLTGTLTSSIILIEYADVECPFCQRHFASQTVSTVIKKHNLKTTFKNFPLSFHPTAQKAAESIICAGKQGKYLEFKDALFTAAINASDGRPSDTVIATTAEKIKLNSTTFATCLQDSKTSDQVQTELNE